MQQISRVTAADLKAIAGITGAVQPQGPCPAPADAWPFRGHRSLAELWEAGTPAPDYTGPRDLGPAHVRAIIDARAADHCQHVTDWQDYVLSGPYHDMLLVTLRAQPHIRLISSPSFAAANYTADQYSIRPLSLTEMWAAMKGDDVIAADLQRMGTTE
ncbi:hypothetical protein [Ferrovibrio sp.]|uniref:hypothetical protein n=1 Tax=Ferrovibrio sp. TaxID=1917215 RepID=UPI00311EF4D6